MTEFNYYSLAEAHLATGVTVVIDVLRAFTTAAYAFDKGVRKILPVSSVDEALALKRAIPESMIMGEVNGLKPEGFDFGNSPASITRGNIIGKTLIQRTSAGTQGLVKAVNAMHLLAGSFVVAKPTAEILQMMKPDRISFIITGTSLGRDGDEDLACAEYIEALVRNDDPDPVMYLDRIRTSSVGQSFLSGNTPYLLETDLAMSAQSNIFDFVLVVNKEEDRLVMRPVTGFNAENKQG